MFILITPTFVIKIKRKWITSFKIILLEGKGQRETHLQGVSGQKTEEISLGPRSPSFQTVPQQTN